MAVLKHSLLMQKEVQETSNYTFDAQSRDHSKAYDLVSDFGFVVLDMPPMYPTETKEPVEEIWFDEDGSDVYNSPQLRFAKFELDIVIGTEGTPSECNQRYDNLLEYLATKTCKMRIYSPADSIGKSGVIFKSCMPDSTTRFMKNGSPVSQFTATLKLVVTAPTSKVTCTASGDKYVLS